MKRKIIFTMLLICISLTACKTEKTVTNESTDAVVEEQDEESITVSENDPSIELFNANNGTATVDITDYVDEVAKMTNEGNIALGTDQKLTDEMLIVDEAYEQTEEAGAVEFTVTPMDKTMYAVKDCNVRKGPDAETYERAGTLNQAQEVKVTGKVNEANWYEISLSDGTTAYVSGTLISEKPQKTKTDENGVPINPETGQPYKPGDVMGVIEYNDGGTAIEIYGGSI